MSNENDINENEESFHKFYESFLHRQKQLCDDLVSASKNHQNDEEDLKRHVNRVIDHYEQYYHLKSISAKRQVLPMFSPSWTTSLESAFLWIGGWRPSTAFHLLYSEAGLQLEAQFHDIISGLGNGNLSDLSPIQLAGIDGFQRRVIKEERDITEELAKHQETVADSSMVELSNDVSTMIRSDSYSETDQLMEKRVESALAPKEEGLEEILQKADDLRLKTLKGIINILNPLQAAHFLIALAQLHLRFHDWGNKKDHNLT